LSARTNSYLYESKKSPVISMKSSINESSDPTPKPHSPQIDSHPERLSDKSTFQKYSPILNLNSEPRIALARRESENSFKKPVLPLPHSNFFPIFNPKPSTNPDPAPTFSSRTSPP
jgi:hypothetical protein